MKRYTRRTKIRLNCYAPDIVHQKVLLEDHAALVFKPVSPGALLRKVRAVLDGKDITER